MSEEQSNRYKEKQIYDLFDEKIDKLIKEKNTILDIVKKMSKMTSNQKLDLGDNASNNGGHRFLGKGDINRLNTMHNKKMKELKKEVRNLVKDLKKIKTKKLSAQWKSKFVDSVITGLFSEAIKESKNLENLRNQNLTSPTGTLYKDSKGKPIKLLSFLDDNITSSLILTDLIYVYYYEKDLPSLAKINVYYPDEPEKQSRAWAGADDLLKKWLGEDISKQTHKVSEELNKQGNIAGTYNTKKAYDKFGNLIKTKNYPSTAYMLYKGKLQVILPASDEDGNLIKDDNGHQMFIDVNGDYVPNDLIPVNQSNIYTIPEDDLFTQILLASFVKSHEIKANDLSKTQISKIEVDFDLLKQYQELFWNARDKQYELAEEAHKQANAQAEESGAKLSKFLPNKKKYPYNIDYLSLAQEAVGKGNELPNGLWRRALLDRERDIINAFCTELKETDASSHSQH